MRTELAFTTDAAQFQDKHNIYAVNTSKYAVICWTSNYVDYNIIFIIARIMFVRELISINVSVTSQILIKDNKK